MSPPITTNKATWRFIGRVMLKASALFVALNLAFALFQPVDALGELSLYNHLVAGRLRLPYGEDDRAHNRSLMSLNAMMNSHVVASHKAEDEYRVLILGDSSVWGYLLPVDATLSAFITDEGVQRDGRQVVAYNLGYPTLSLTKDLLILQQALRHQPDHILWLTTLQAFPRQRQIEASPLVQHNAPRVDALVAQYGLDVPTDALQRPDWLGRTLVGQRRALADWWRLQWYGLGWQATGIDHTIGAFTPRANDFEADIAWQAGGLTHISPLDDDLLAWDVLALGHRLIADNLGEGVRVTLINAPIFIADGVNSHLRYNAWYPRWVYDAYRARYAHIADAEGWHYVDLWDSIPAEAFTDSPLHLTEAGTRALASLIVAHLTNAP